MTACIRLPPYLAFPKRIVLLGTKAMQGSHLPFDTVNTRCEGGPNALGGITGELEGRYLLL